MLTCWKIPSLLLQHHTLSSLTLMKGEWKYREKLSKRRKVLLTFSTMLYMHHISLITETECIIQVQEMLTITASAVTQTQTWKYNHGCVSC